MLKSIVAIVVSYAVMALFFIAVFNIGYLALGADRVFQPDSYEVSTLWLVLGVLFPLLGSLLAGYLCAAIGKSWRTCQVFAFIVFLLGLVACIPALKRDPDAPNVRAGEVPNFQAVRLAVSPIWAHLLTPVVSAGGVLLGARRKARPAS